MGTAATATTVVVFNRPMAAVGHIPTGPRCVVMQVSVSCADHSSSSSNVAAGAVGTPCNLSLHLAASLLQLRGTSPSTSPLQDINGNVLCFNGEVFSGLNIPEGGNDGKALLAALQQASSCDAAAAQSSSDDSRGDSGSSAAAGVVEVLSKLRGPWSLIYWQGQQQTLWFARDLMGECVSTEH